MNDLTIFNSSEFGEIRTVTIDGKPYFVAVDVAAALGYATPRDAISRHCKGVVKRDTPTSSGIQQMSYINEGDLYRLIMKSKLPSAEKFESWVVDEVLPAIRKTGSYQIKAPQGKELLALAVLEAQKTIEAQTAEIERMWYFLDCHSAQCDNESGGDCGYCKKDFYDEIDKIVEQLKNELSNH